MTPDKRHLADTVAAIAVGNIAVWTIQEVSYVVSIFVGVVSSVWIILQCTKFVQRWIREERARAAKLAPTDYSDLSD